MLSKQEYNTITRLYADGLYRFCLKTCGNVETAKDVVQDSFMKLWQRRKDVEVETAKSYLFKIGHRRCIDLYRSETSRKSRELVLINDSSIKPNYDQQDFLDKAFSSLKAEQKSLVLLRDYEGYSYEEISDLTQLSLALVKVNLFRARKRLQEVVKQLENEWS